MYIYTCKCMFMHTESAASVVALSHYAENHYEIRTA